MKKELLKKILVPALAAVAFGSVSVGATFALFTSEAETTIDLTAGKIDLKAPVTISSAWELNDVAMTKNSDFDWTNTIGAHIYKDANQIIHLDKLAPGDGAEFTLTPDNSLTNINIKARLAISLQGELAPALEIEALAGTERQLAFRGVGTAYTPWEDVAVGSNPTAFKVKVSFPDHDDGEIRHGTANKDNQYQNLSATISLGYEAIQGNADVDDTLPIINAALTTAEFEEGRNQTMFDALQDLSAAQITAISERGYVWNVDTDRFCEFSLLPAQPYKYFKMYDSMPAIQNYSIYAVGTAWGVVDDLTVGFDAGEVGTITSIHYDRHDATDAQSVIIRTNSAMTNLTIDAPLDTVTHYGSVGSLNVVAVANSSYHEFGKAAFAEVKAGRLVLEEESKIAKIHIDKKDDAEAFNPITIVNNGGAAALPDKITRDKVAVPENESKLVVTVITAQVEEEVYVYPHVDSTEAQTGTTEKITEGENKQNENVNSALGQLVLDDGAEPGEKAYSTQEKEEVKEEAVAETQVEEAEEKGIVLTHHDYLAPTCTAAGHYEYESYMEGEVEMKIGYKEIPALGHDPSLETGLCTECGTRVYQAKIGNTGYATLQAAWNAAAGTGQTVVLLCDLTQNAYIARNSYVLDLNGHTLTLNGHPQAENAGLFIDGDSSLNRDGEVTIRNGTLNFTGTGASNYGIYCYGTLNLKDVTINSVCNETIHFEGHSWGHNTTSTLDGVTINATKTGIQANGYKSYWSDPVIPTVDISDSEIISADSGSNAVAINGAVANVNSSVITNTASGGALYAYASGTASGLTAHLNLSGNMRVNASSDYYRVRKGWSNTYEIIAVAGTYNFDPSSYVDGDNYNVSYDDVQGLWTVAQA